MTSITAIPPNYVTANVLKLPIKPKIYLKNKDARKLEPQKVQPKIEKPVVSASYQKGQIFTNKPLIGKRTAHAIGAGLAVGRIAVDVAHEYADWKGEVVTRKAERVHHMVDNQVNSTKEAIREGCHRFDERKMAAEQEIRRLEEMDRNQQTQKTNLIFTCTVALAVFALATSSFSTGSASHKASPIDAAKTNFGQVNQGMKNNHMEASGNPDKRGNNGNPNDWDPCQESSWPEGGKEPVKLSNGQTVPTEKRFTLSPDGDAKGTVPNQKMRNEMKERGGLAKDDAGHLQAKEDGGCGTDPLNLAPMNRNLNRGAFRQFESEAREWLDDLQQMHPGKKVEGRSSVKPFYSPDSGRPEFISYTIYYCVDGKLANMKNGKFNQRHDGVPSLLNILFDFFN